jgi:hypothetical protein
MFDQFFKSTLIKTNFAPTNAFEGVRREVDAADRGGPATRMPTVWSVYLKRRFSAPIFSGATIFVFLVYIALILASFLIAYYSHGSFLASTPLLTEAICHPLWLRQQCTSWLSRSFDSQSCYDSGQAFGSRRAPTGSSRGWSSGRSSRCACSASTPQPGTRSNLYTGIHSSCTRPVNAALRPSGNGPR